MVCQSSLEVTLAPEGLCVGSRQSYGVMWCGGVWWGVRRDMNL